MIVAVPIKGDMKRCLPAAKLLFLVSAVINPLIPFIYSGDITGRIKVTNGLTKKRVTLSPYAQRGGALPLLPEAPLAANDELSRVAIYLEGTGLKPAEPLVAQLDQRNRRFEPEVVIIPTGSTVSFPNSDPIFHNVFSLSKPRAFDLGYYPEGQTRKVQFDTPGIVQVFCHLHPNMSAAIVVTPSRWSTQPRNDGTFVLSSIPPGRYQLVVWHKSAGFFRRKVEVKDSTVVSLNFEIPVRDSSPEP
jgi:plastocyanin